MRCFATGASNARWFLPSLAAFGLLLFLAAPVQADPKASLNIVVIHAKKGPPFLHPDLKPLWATLKKTFGDKFGYYNKLQDTVRQVAKLGKTSIKMPDGERFAAIYKGITPNKGLLRIALEYGDFRTKVRIHDGGLFFQAGRKHDGGVLVVAIQARLLEE
ncbi:MAG: hypothetical protein ISR64_04570 [Deltaproteobacteria bacterium]|nr:hypothetical protein [Deltaproteobacteria bacterium]